VEKTSYEIHVGLAEVSEGQGVNHLWNGIDGRAKLGRRDGGEQGKIGVQKGLFHTRRNGVKALRNRKGGE